MAIICHDTLSTMDEMRQSERTVGELRHEAFHAPGQSKALCTAWKRDMTDTVLKQYACRDGLSLAVMAIDKTTMWTGDG